MAQRGDPNSGGDLAAMMTTRFLFRHILATLTMFAASCGSAGSNGPIEEVSSNASKGAMDSGGETTEKTDTERTDTDEEAASSTLAGASPEPDAPPVDAHSSSSASTGGVADETTDSVGETSHCDRGQVKRIERSRFSIRVKLCNGKEREFSFKRPVVDVRSNPVLPYIAVYTTSLDDDIPEADAEELYPGALFIVDAAKGKKSRYRPAWSPTYHYGLWSPDGAYAAFLRGDYGPIDIVKSARLWKYLKNYANAYRVVNTNPNPSDHNPVHAMAVVGWQSRNRLLFTNGCCGDIWKTEYNLETDEYRRLECAYGYCMRIRYNQFETHQKDVTIEGETLTKHAVSVQLKRYFGYISERCFLSEDGNRPIDTGGEFSLSFRVGTDGKIEQPKIVGLKTDQPLLDTSIFSDCLIKTAGEMSFAETEHSGAENATIRVMMHRKIKL